jgi:hypothetical protein
MSFLYLYTKRMAGLQLILSHELHRTNKRNSHYYYYYYFLWLCSQARAIASSTRFFNHTQRITVGRISLDEWSARHRDLYLTSYVVQQTQQSSMPPVGFEPTIAGGERPWTYALDRAATGTGPWSLLQILISFIFTRCPRKKSEEYRCKKVIGVVCL